MKESQEVLDLINERLMAYKKDPSNVRSWKQVKQNLLVNLEKIKLEKLKKK